jgi:hypothetical protein
MLNANAVQKEMSKIDYFVSVFGVIYSSNPSSYRGYKNLL